MVDFSMLLTVFVGLGTVVVNLLILGMAVKLYTEYFKDRSASRRRDGGDRGQEKG